MIPEIPSKIPRQALPNFKSSREEGSNDVENLLIRNVALLSWFAAGPDATGGNSLSGIQDIAAVENVNTCSLHLGTPTHRLEEIVL